MRPMDRRTKLLDGLSLADSTGVEIGALNKPMVRRSDGRVIYVDHASTEALREKYAADPDVDIDDIVSVDVVMRGGLAESVGRKVDYVVASHVVEHVPDLISWLEDIHSMLNPGGEVRLVVPDKRFTFDRIRAQTKLHDVLYARLIEATRPHPHVVLDYVLNVTKVDGSKAWRGTLDESELERHHTLAHAVNCAVQAKEGVYHDVHCWVFTPRSFCLLFAEMAENGLPCFECTNFHDTAPDTIEFFVGMRPAQDKAAAVASWMRAAESCDPNPLVRECTEVAAPAD